MAHVLAQQFDPSVLIEGDAFFGFLQRGAIDPWLAESNDQNHVVARAAASATGVYAAGGYTTVYDGIVGPWFMDVFVAASGLDHVEYVLLLPPIERCIARVQTRKGHGFTDEAATRKMHAQFAAAAATDVDERHVFADVPDDVDAVAAQILAARAGDGLVYVRS